MEDVAGWNSATNPIQYLHPFPPPPPHFLLHWDSNNNNNAVFEAIWSAHEIRE